MLDLNEITEVSQRALSDYEHKGWTEEQNFIARARTWLPALVEELREAQAKIEHLRVLVPSADLLHCLADYTESATDSQRYYQPSLAASGIVVAREARALAAQVKEYDEWKEANGDGGTGTGDG